MPLSRKNVKIVVLGDIGHSPRMTNHAVCIANKGNTVDLIGYGDSDPKNALRLSAKVYYHYLWAAPKLPFKYLNYIWKTIWTTLNLLFLMFITRRSDVVLVQNPPAIPALYVCWFYCKIVGAELVVDWHNYGHTIMALSVGQKSPLVSITRRIEVAVGRRADYNFCVSRAMKKDLYSRWQIRTEVLYDRPSGSFYPLIAGEKHDFLTALSRKKGFEMFVDHTKPYSTIITHVPPTGGIHYREDRPALVLTSTSWTEDEDFSLLINALQAYEDHWQSGNEKKLPKMLMVITGKGPMKDHYCKDMESRKWEHIRVVTLWLHADDYPGFVGCADIGVCLHTSSSGLDLPMKVVDLFGACIPVFAYNFKALSELVVDGKNGYVFSSHQELARLLQDWFENFPHNENIIGIMKAFKKDLMNQRYFTWKKIWNEVAGPIF